MIIYDTRCILRKVWKTVAGKDDTTHTSNACAAITDDDYLRI